MTSHVKNFRGLAGRFLRDEQGQSTTEYILILSVVVMIALKFKNQISTRLDTAVDKLGTNINTAIDD